MLPEDYSFYNFFIDVIIPLGIFIIGLMIENKWHIVGNLLNLQDKSKTKQSQAVDGQDNLALQMRDNYGVVAVNKKDEDAPEKLPYKEEEFTKTVVKIMVNKNIELSFAERYKGGRQHLKNGCASLAASAYLSAFLPTEEIFLEVSNYREDLNKGLVNALENGFIELKFFSDKSLNDTEELRKIITGIENTLGSLFGYLL